MALAIFSCAAVGSLSLLSFFASSPALADAATSNASTQAVRAWIVRTVWSPFLSNRVRAGSHSRPAWTVAEPLLQLYHEPVVLAGEAERRTPRTRYQDQ